MKMSGFICQDEYLSKTSKLTDSELGRLFRALMAYHITGEVSDLGTRLEMAFDFIRDDIDRDDVSYQKKCKQASENRRGGSSQEKTDVNARQRPSTDDNGCEQYNRIEKNRTEENINKPLIDDDDNAHATQHDHDRVLDAAEDAGFKMSNSVRAALIDLYAVHGLEKLLGAFRSCVEHGVPTLAYLKAVLKGEPKSPPGKVVSAQQFTQRDYQDEQDNAMRRMLEGMTG